MIPLMIFALGTLWCGDGNIAKNPNDLGTFNDTDACCRDHDNCKHNLAVNEVAVNIINDSTFTKSACVCDIAFYNCLKKVNSIPSSGVGKTYFNILKPQCFMCPCPMKDCKPNDGTECKDHCKKYQWVDNKSY